MPPRRTNKVQEKEIRAEPALDSLATDIDKPSFDTIYEVDDLFDRLRKELYASLERQKASTSEAVDVSEVERIVFETFLSDIRHVLLSNCAVSGIGYSLERKAFDSPLPTSDPSSSDKVEPFSEDLHDKVTKYQDELFVARAVNANKRRKLFERADELVSKKLASDREWLTKVEAAAPQLPQTTDDAAKRRRSTDPFVSARIQKIESHYAASARDLELLLESGPELNARLEDAIEVTRDLRRL